MADAPIIAGFHPDPSICRVGEDFYIANSSFEYSPGVPIWHSTDLRHWGQIGHALRGPSPLPPGASLASTGIYAPTLRHHDGRFWLITTDIAEIQRGHLIVSAEDAAGPWSEPVYTTGTVGIDPDLCWDEAGVCHLTWASFDPGLPGIASVPIDPATGEMRDAPQLLWPGTGLAAPEAPHLYRLDGWWYLLLAEGGTERGHAVTIARSRTLDGDWEPAPTNPILSHRSLSVPVQNTGHGDLVQLPDGSWAMVYLGVRPRGKTPGFHTNGRETFLAGVEWVDGWPVVVEDRYEAPVVDRAFTETFPEGPLHPRWVSRGGSPERLLSKDGESLRVAPVDGEQAPAILACRVTDFDWTADVVLQPAGGVARFTVQIDEAHWYGLTVSSDRVDAVLRIGPASTTVGQVPRDPGDPVALRLRARTAPGDMFRPADEADLVTMAVVDADGREQVLGEFDGRYVSTEVASGFTGRVLTLEAHGGPILVDSFRYTVTASESVG
ncbi:family 43 glycosylhydrolase [Brachybacterium paraconglomeratum]|uniref:glycoside hydrolase family 43 protein n=1 Tax=Brachybacterium paraconglomeratum TaxID=173362 RepID=UPI0037C6641C